MSPLQAAKHVARHKYAWPGGYPLFVITTDGGCLCPDCVKSNWREIVSATLSRHNSGWQAAAADINYEDPALFCDHCGNRIESAYAEEGAAL